MAGGGPGLFSSSAAGLVRVSASGSVSLGVHPGPQLCPGSQRAAVGYGEVKVTPGGLDPSSLLRPSYLARYRGVTSTPDTKRRRNPRKPQELSRAEQQLGVPNFGEAAGPCLSRQCHLLPLHTRPRPTPRRRRGRGQRGSPREEPQVFEPSPESLSFLQASPNFHAKPETPTRALRRAPRARENCAIGGTAGPTSGTPSHSHPPKTPPCLVPR